MYRFLNKGHFVRNQSKWYELKYLMFNWQLCNAIGNCGAFNPDISFNESVLIMFNVILHHFMGIVFFYICNIIISYLYHVTSG